MPRHAGSTLPLYVGGFLGPFGGAVVPVLIPQLRVAFDAPTETIAAAMPAYLIPFALLQLVSGTLGERLGRRRLVRAAYLVYALACVASALAPDAGTFLATRALAGVANAFLSPLLLAGLAETATDGGIGRRVGTFAAVQTAAVALSPLCGGLLGAVGWRLAFLVPAAVGLALAFVPPSDAAARPPGTAPARLRSLFSHRMGLLTAAAFGANCGIVGVAFLVALTAADRFGIGSIERGLVLAGFGVAGMLLGRQTGSAVDRFGRVPVAVCGAALSAVVIASLGLAPGPISLAALWTLAGVGSSLVWTSLNTLAVEAVPANRAGATSVVGAFKFAGSAAAPILWLPLYHLDPRLGFLGAGVMAALTGALILRLAGRARLRAWLRSRSPRSVTPSPPSSTPSGTSAPTSPPSAGAPSPSGSSPSAPT
jgi:MFS family permease